MIYRSDIDGLRAIAVVAVMLFHLDALWLPGGFMGVDIFYVISGYLITGIIVGKIENGTFSILTFWMRRVRRLLPALYFVLLVTSIFCWNYYSIPDFKNFAASLVAATFQSSNIYFYLSADYFDSASHVKPLLHTWTLAVEEQYYAVFPFLCIALFAFVSTSRKRLFLYCIAMLASLLAFLWGANYAATEAFYLFPFRAWEMLLGGMPFLISGDLRKRISVKKNLVNGSWFLGLGLIIVGLGSYSAEMKFPGAICLVPAVGTALMLWCGSHADHWGVKLFSLPTLVFVGKTSYSLYLWHWPVYVLLLYSGQSLGTIYGATLAVSITSILAVCSYYLVEDPIRKSSVVKSNQRLLFALFCVGVITSFVGFLGYGTNGLGSRLDDSARQISAVSVDYSEDRERCYKAREYGELCSFGFAEGDLPLFLVFGDSHAEALMPAFKEIAESGDARFLISYEYGCPPLYGIERVNPPSRRSCAEFFAETTEAVANYDIDGIILVARWSDYVNQRPPSEAGSALLRDVDHTISGQSIENSRKVFLKGFSLTIPLLKTISPEIILIQQLPEFGSDPATEAFKQITFQGRDQSTVKYPVIDWSEYQARNSFVNEVFVSRQSETVHLVDLSELFCTKNSVCTPVLHGFVAYRDNDHLSASASRTIKDVIWKSISELKERW